jgi:hypothetical protein
MIATVHLADVGIARTLRLLTKRPRPDNTPGLRHANLALTAPLRGASLPVPTAGRIGLVAMWDDDAAADRFEAEHPLAAALAGGFQVRLDPLRAHGTWPGLPVDVATSRTVDHEGPAAVLTLARLRLGQTIRFLRTSGKAEKAALGAPGLIWATALALPPFVATCSLWEDTGSLSTYAYGAREPSHPDAIAEDDRKGFHHESAFIRFRPYAARGALHGRNPLEATWMQTSVRLSDQGEPAGERS